jgi:hypothetical protein
MSMPFSAMTAIANGWTDSFGCVPALKASMPIARAKPSAIWLRAELPVQTNKTRFGTSHHLGQFACVDFAAGMLTWALPLNEP